MSSCMCINHLIILVLSQLRQKLLIKLPLQMIAARTDLASLCCLDTGMSEVHSAGTLILLMTVRPMLRAFGSISEPDLCFLLILHFKLS